MIGYSTLYQAIGDVEVDARYIRKIWSGKWDSNPRPSAWESVSGRFRPCPYLSETVYLLSSAANRGGADVRRCPALSIRLATVWLQ